MVLKRIEVLWIQTGQTLTDGTKLRRIGEKKHA